MMETKSTDQETMQTDVTTRVRERSKTDRNLKGDTNYFCMSDHLADVWFAFNDDTSRLPAHKLLLSMRSEVFEKMFYGSLAESSDTIKVEDINVSTMKMVLRYIYSDTVKLNGKTVTSCLYAAKKYLLYSLADKCTEFLTNAIGVETACTIYEQAKVYDELSLKTKCIDFITGNSKDILLSEDFRLLSFESVLEITKNENLSSDESFIFTAVNCWGNSECKRKGLQVTPENLRACLGDILFSIRFPLMQIEMFAKEVVPTDILTTEEMLMIYNHLAVKAEAQEVQSVGRFSCTKRNVVIRFDHLNLQPTFQECMLLLSTSNSIRLSSIQGSFIQQVENVTVSCTRSKVIFDKHDDKLDFCEPILLKQQYGNIKILFQLKLIDEQTTNKASWSTNFNDSRTAKTSSVFIRCVPCSLKALVFKDV